MNVVTSNMDVHSLKIFEKPHKYVSLKGFHDSMSGGFAPNIFLLSIYITFSYINRSNLTD
jgi:hypothetical protein